MNKRGKGAGEEGADPGSGRAGNRAGRGRGRPPAAWRRFEGLEWLLAIGGGVTGYLGAEMLLASTVHWIHWIAAFALVAVGGASGWAWNTWQQSR